MDQTPTRPARNKDISIPGLEIHYVNPPNPWKLIVISKKRQAWGTYSGSVQDSLAPRLAPTTLYYWGEEFRIERERETEDGWMYCALDWPANEPVIHPIELTGESLLREATLQRNLNRMAAKQAIAPYYEFMLGFLPSRVQHDLSEKLEFSPEDASRVNARVTTYFGLAMAIFSWSITGRILGLYFMADGVVRRMFVITHERPCGWIVFELFDWLFVKPILRILPDHITKSDTFEYEEMDSPQRHGGTENEE